MLITAHIPYHIMVWLYAAAVAMFLVVISPAMAQIYETPQTLTVTISPPSYTYVDTEGYMVTTGVVRNDSEMSYVGNVILLTKFYGETAPLPLAVASGGTLLDVIPPGGSSPYVIRTSEPDPRIHWASTSMLIFDPANPKITGLSLEWSDGVLTIRDMVGAPHSNVTIHLAYHDVFDPPRILKTSTYHIRDIDIGGSYNFTVAETYPAAVFGVMAFAESDVFSAQSISWRVPAAAPTQPTLPAHILDAWMTDMHGERTLTTHQHQNTTLNAEVLTPEGGEYWLYVQVSSKESGGVVLLERALIDDNMVSIPWTPADDGEYIAEMFLWGETGAPASRPGPILLLTIR